MASLIIALLGFCPALGTQQEPSWAAASLRFYWFRLADAMLPAGTALAMIGIAAASPQSRRWWLAGAAVASLLVATDSRSSYAVTMLFRNAPRADAPSKVADHADWRAACLWIAEHTPADAVFLTPRLAQRFTWYAGRGEVVTWKDLPQDAASIVEWWRRLAAQYGAQYLVTLAEPPLDLPRLYVNETYAVYKLR